MENVTFGDVLLCKASLDMVIVTTVWTEGDKTYFSGISRDGMVIDSVILKEEFYQNMNINLSAIPLSAWVNDYICF